jgi:hypothetical protein
MEITLEKIELVKDRTGVSYKEAKDALESADGSVVDAILAIEEQSGAVTKDDHDFTDNPIFKKAKEIVDKGNMSSIIIKSGDKEVVDFPLSVGVLGAVLVPWAAIFGIVASIGLNCSIEFVNDKGELVDINGKIIGVYDKAKDATSGVTGKGSEIFKVLKGKGTEAFHNVKEQVQDAAEELKSRTNAMSDKPFEDVDFEVELNSEDENAEDK